MAIKFHGLLQGSPSLRVLAAIHEKELEYDYVPVDMKSGAHKQDPFLSLNPFGKIPAFEDGDIKLFESRAITTYIAFTYANQGTPLVYKDDAKQRTNIVLWSEVEAQQFDRVASNLTRELIYHVMFGMETDNAIVEENEAMLAKVLDVYESHLATSKYLAGDSFTLADLHHLPCVQYLSGTKINKIFEERPHVNAWCKDILARPAWKKAFALQNQA